MDLLTLDEEKNFRILIQKWNTGINIKDEELEYLVHVFKIFQIWLFETKECNVLLYEIGRKIDLANSMIESRKKN